MLISLLLVTYVFNAPSSILLNYFAEGEGSAFNPYINLVIGEGLTIGYIISSLVIVAMFQFFAYLKNLRILYTLPLISGLIVLGCLYLNHNDTIIYLFGFTVAFLLLLDALRTRNGVEIGIGFIVLFVLSCLPTVYEFQIFLYGVARLGFMCLVFLGVSGLLDEWLFYDKELKEKIENTWITKRVVIKQE
jgi:hypothetical protein